MALAAFVTGGAIGTVGTFALRRAVYERASVTERRLVELSGEEQPVWTEVDRSDELADFLRTQVAVRWNAAVDRAFLGILEAPHTLERMYNSIKSAIDRRRNEN
mmetsp:Transcript_4949/g.14896  ORF Transcript_4949/g.14896 Transcript_4949/m.14896 type:complete len:104 (+) Transcript_4949:148-459(+)